jgi:hypothetical protein
MAKPKQRKEFIEIEISKLLVIVCILLIFLHIVGVDKIFILLISGFGQEKEAYNKSQTEIMGENISTSPQLTPQQQCENQGNVWCNNQCVSPCSSGFVLGNDCVCHKQCGTSYCSEGSVCCNNKCYSPCSFGYKSICKADGLYCTKIYTTEDNKKNIVYIKHDVAGCCDSYGQISNQLGNSGSGVIFLKDNVTNKVAILTSRHVIDCVFAGTCMYPTSESITIIARDGNAYTPTLVAYAPNNLDLAILEFQTTSDIGETMVKPEDYSVGDLVTAIGYPVFGVQSPKPILQFSVTEGTITNIYNLLTYEGLQFNAIQTDAISDHGASGGGLFNQDGQLIGIITWGDREQRLTIAIDYKVIFDIYKRGGKFVGCTAGSYRTLDGYCCLYGTIAKDGKCYEPCGQPNSYCPPPNICCNNRCYVPCSSGFVLGSDCICHLKCGDGYCRTGAICCNNVCYSPCPSGYYMATDCKCYPY